MKTITRNGQNVVIIRERGTGDGGVVLRYMIEEADGTYSQVGNWYSDPVAAQKDYDAPDDAFTDWAIVEARRQVLPRAERPPQEPLPKRTR